jgi:hypothetical protein
MNQRLELPDCSSSSTRSLRRQLGHGGTSIGETVAASRRAGVKTFACAAPCRDAASNDLLAENATDVRVREVFGKQPPVWSRINTSLRLLSACGQERQESDALRV